MPREQPDRAALEIAHRKAHNKMSLDDMLKVPSLKATLYAMARRHMRNRSKFDPKKMQANDND